MKRYHDAAVDGVALLEDGDVEKSLEILHTMKWNVVGSVLLHILPLDGMLGDINHAMLFLSPLTPS